MLALASVWISLATLMLALAMVAYRPAFNDVTVPLVVMFGGPGAMCLAGMVLWSLRKEPAEGEGVAAQRLQSKVAIGLAVIASAIVYVLVIYAQRLPQN